MMRGRPVLLAMGFVLAFAGTAAEAHCDKNNEALLRFALAAPPSTFAAWGASGEEFCPRTFVTRDWPATADQKETWMVKFDRTVPWTDLDTTAGAVADEFTPVLKSAGYTAKPAGEATVMGFEMRWESAGKPPVAVEVEDKSADEPDEMPGKTLIEIKVYHSR
jgi:hypothetical protein